MLRNYVFSAKKPKTAFARYLRSNQTSGENLLWKKLRAKRFHNLKFRRQVPIGPYIVDFLCIEKRLIIEIDGGSHYKEGAKQRDNVREEYLRNQKFSFLRFGELQTKEDIDSVLTKIGEFLDLYNN